MTISFTAPKRTPEPDKALIRRATNRHLYDSRPVDDATFAWLREATPALDAARTVWFGRERVRTLGPIVEEAETLLLSDPRQRDSALAGIRFDVRDREEVTRGMALGSLELSTAERVTFDTLRRTPQDRLVAMGVFKKMAGRTRRLVESASGVCLITASGTEPAVDVAVGRSLQRAWLGLTRRGLVAQPVSSFATLEAAEGIEGAAIVLASLRAAFPSVEKGARIAILLRFGWAPAPTVWTRRLPLEDSVALVGETVPPAGP